MLNDMGAAHWMDAVEELNKKIQPIIRISKKLIDDSRFEIEHMPKMKRIPKPEHSIMKRGDYSGQGPMIELE